MPHGTGWTALPPSEQEFASAPSWRPEDTTGRGILELSDRLTRSRGNLWRFPPGVKGRRHSHKEQEEVFVVVEGTLTMELGEERRRVELPSGSIVVLEAGTQILIANETDAQAAMFVSGTPPVTGDGVIHDG
jgi:quercetin dioxygenase-like cupin family protein